MSFSKRKWLSGIVLFRLSDIFILACLLILLWPPSPAHADPTDLDQDFGNLGLTVTNVNLADLTPKSLVPMPDGRYAIVGTIRDRFESSNRDGIAVAIYGANGLLETKHGIVGLNGVMVERPSAWFNDLPNTQIDNLVLNSVSAAYHVRNGVPGIVVGCQVQVTDTVLVETSTYNILLRFQLADDDQVVRIGFLDPEFGTSGHIRTVASLFSGNTFIRFLQAVAVDSQQRILILNDYQVSAAPPVRIEIERRLPGGALDGSWGDAGAQVLDLPIRDPGHKLMIGSGDSVHVIASRVTPPYTDLAFARLGSNGVLDTGYGAADGLTFVRASSTFTTNLIKAVFDPDGRLLFTGIATGSAFMARLLANGQFDSSFSGNIDGTADGFYSSVSTPPFGCAVAVQPDGRIVTTLDGGGAVWIYRFLADAVGEDDTFIDFLDNHIVDPFGELNIENRTFRCFDMHLQNDGKIVVAGQQSANFADPGETAPPLTGFALIRLEGGDMDPPAVTATIRFEQTSFLVLENSLFLTLRVLRSGAIDEEVSVAYQTINGTATAGSDFTAVSGTLTFAPGVTEREFVISILNDGADLPEPDEQFSVVLSAPSVNAVIADGGGEAIITIRDAAAPLILLDSIFPPDDRLIDFGIVAVNGRATASLEIRNGTPLSAPRTLAVSANLAGGSNAAFRIESSSCGTLVPTSAGICSLFISVEPLTAGAMGGTIQIHFVDVADPDYSGTATVQLQGLASNDADLEVSVTLLNPPPQKIADDLARFRITVVNRGPVPVNNPRVTITFDPEFYAGTGPEPQFGTAAVQQIAAGSYAWSAGPLGVNGTANINVATRLRLVGDDDQAIAFVRANAALVGSEDPGVSDPLFANNEDEVFVLIGGSDYRLFQTTRTRNSSGIRGSVLDVDLGVENLGPEDGRDSRLVAFITFEADYSDLGDRRGTVEFVVTTSLCSLDPATDSETVPRAFDINSSEPMQCPLPASLRNGAVGVHRNAFSIQFRGGGPLTGSQRAVLRYTVELRSWTPAGDIIVPPRDLNPGNNRFVSEFIISSANGSTKTGVFDPLVLAMLLPLMIVLAIARRQNSNSRPPR